MNRKEAESNPKTTPSLALSRTCAAMSRVRLMPAEVVEELQRHISSLTIIELLLLSSWLFGVALRRCGDNVLEVLRVWLNRSLGLRMREPDQMTAEVPPTATIVDPSFDQVEFNASGSMMKNRESMSPTLRGRKVYAVRRGFCPGIYHTWEECERSVKGFSGAQFRGFKWLEEAEMYMRG